MTLPAPADIGAPDHYSGWRPHQPAAILAITDSQRRFIGSVLPTGAGKSLTVVGAALLAGWRTAFLTSTKLLQEQYGRDFADMADIRGQGSYQCLAFDDEHWKLKDDRWQGCDEGPCRAGYPCARKPERDEAHVEKGCTYYDSVARTLKAQLVVTNYKYWLSVNNHGAGLGRFDCLVLDEAHHAPNELADFLSTSLEPIDFQLLGSGGPGCEDPSRWAEWAKVQSARVQQALGRRPESRADLRHHKTLRRVGQELAVLSAMAGEDWLVREHGQAWFFDPVWVAGQAEKVLFRGVPRVVCTSATFTRKTAEMMGIADANLTWHEAPSDFPPERRPVYYVPCVKLDYKADPSQIRLWLATIDNVLRARRDRKGIIHAVSYQRAKMIREYSEFAGSMILHDRHDTRDAVARFKQAGPGAILVSPSVTTGYDFPGAQCEFQVIAKIPFPDSRSPVVKARSERDKDYGAYIAMQELVQAVGRGMRSAEDQCETFLLDNNASWFMRKHRDLAPSWFLESYRRVETLPEPPLALS